MPRPQSFEPAAIKWTKRLLRYAAILLPLLAWVAFLITQNAILLALAGLFSVAVILSQMLFFEQLTQLLPPAKRLVNRIQIANALDRAFGAPTADTVCTACIAVQLDDFGALQRDITEETALSVLAEAEQRLIDASRDDDIICALGEGRYAIAMTNAKVFQVGTLLELSARIKALLSDSFDCNGSPFYTRVSVGFCASQKSPGFSGDALLEAAQTALEEARHHGAGSVRAFSEHMAPRVADRQIARDALEKALEEDEIVPWFQPQVDAHTLAVTGMEALARWESPDHGVLPPHEFIAAINALRMSERLCYKMVSGALKALTRWDEEGFDIPTVGVNFSMAELSDPALVERITWELDRFDLSANRLSVEILEDVVSNKSDDIIAKNVAELQRMGCKIDLDDFGTGHASLTNMRRYNVARIKIDRSYVAGCDLDMDQYNLIAAVVAMADRIGLETLAEGVETIGEQKALAKIGCGALQGYSISRPVSFDASVEWLRSHQARLSGVAEPRSQVS